MTKISLELGKLIEAAASFKQQSLIDNVPLQCSDLNLRIPTPSGLQPINYLIKKNNLKKVTIEFECGHSITCAEKHILSKEGIYIFAENIVKGDLIDTRDAPLCVKNINFTDNCDFYDINVPYPHLYYDEFGIIHHNTIITCALSHLCEDYGRTIVIVPNKDLVRQTEADYKNIGLDVGVYFGDRKEYNRKHTICTWQSLDRIIKKEKDGTGTFTFADFINDVVCVIVDECLAKNTKILTPTGNVAIQDLKPGDAIFSYNERTKEFESDTVVKLHINIASSSKEDMYELEMNDGSIINITGNHKVLTVNGWKQVKELDIDDDIVDYNSN